MRFQEATWHPLEAGTGRNTSTPYVGLPQDCGISPPLSKDGESDNNNSGGEDLTYLRHLELEPIDPLTGLPLHPGFTAKGGRTPCTVTRRLIRQTANQVSYSFSFMMIIYDTMIFVVLMVYLYNSNHNSRYNKIAFGHFHHKTCSSKRNKKITRLFRPISPKESQVVPTRNWERNKSNKKNGLSFESHFSSSIVSPSFSPPITSTLVNYFFILQVSKPN